MDELRTFSSLTASNLTDSLTPEITRDILSQLPSSIMEHRRHSSQFSVTHRVGKDSRYIKTSRDPRYSTIEDLDVAEFQKIVGNKGVLTEESELEAANTDWMRKYVGASKVLLRPRTTQEVCRSYVLISSVKDFLAFRTLIGFLLYRFLKFSIIAMQVNLQWFHKVAILVLLVEASLFLMRYT